MMIPLLALDFVAPIIGGVVLASAVSFFGGVLLAKKESDHVETTLDERRLLGLETEVQRLHRERIGARLEDQLLQEFFRHSDITLGLTACLKQIVPQPSVGFAAIVGTGSSARCPTTARGLSEQSLERLAIPLELIRRLQTETQVVVHPDADDSGLFRSLDETDRQKARRLYLTAFDDGKELFAVLVTSSLWPFGLTEDEQQASMKRVVRQIGARWHQTLVVEHQSRELRATQSMLELKSIVDSQTDEPLEALERFATRLCESVGADRAAIYFVARRTGEQLQPIVQCGRPIPHGAESVWQRHEQALANVTIESELGSLFDGEWLQDLQVDSLITSAAVMPIRVNGRVLGALCLTRRVHGNVLEENRKLIDFAAETLSQTLRRVFDEATIRRQARHDHLTDLVNRRSFDAYLATEVERVQRGESSDCSLILADLDRFKSYNDRHGHQAGDHVLRETARVLADQVSRLRMGEHSIVARFGGEEFAILLPNVGVAGALRIAEGIRSSIERAPIRIQNVAVDITISIGVANCPHHSNTADSLVAVADKALYLAKSNGRNCVCQPENEN